MKHLLLATLLTTSGFTYADATLQNLADGYGELAYATYSDALVTAQALQESIATLVASPSKSALYNAKSAWLEARPSYQQSEVFRFGNAIVDDWEGQLNAWPLDEGLIDYVDTKSYAYELGNDGGAANVIANTQVGDLDVTLLTPQTLVNLNEFGGSEANVATGYHAIEFLLWGQDLNGFSAGAGDRPWTDYGKENDCTNAYCDRRGDYLKAATDLLVSNLQYMVKQWSPNGDYRKQLATAKPEAVINKMLFGMGSLALGELAGERIKVALTANSFEDEHDCFSDNTHNSIYFNAQGIANLYYGHYTNHEGKTTIVTGLRDYFVQAGALALVTDADTAFENTSKTFSEIVARAEQKETFDQMIAPGNTQGQALLNSAINDLVSETAIIEQMASAIGIAQLTPDNAGHSF